MSGKGGEAMSGKSAGRLVSGKSAGRVVTGRSAGLTRDRVKPERSAALIDSNLAHFIIRH
jgi:hypothetical protein